VDPVVVGLLTSFLGATAAIFIGEAAKRRLLRRWAATDLARDALIDTLTALRALEDVLESLMRASLPESPTRNDLASQPSGWFVSMPVLEVAKLIDTLDNEDAHAAAILLHDQLAAFARVNVEHERAYYWLLDDASARPAKADAPFDRDEPSVRERLDVIRAARAQLQPFAIRALRNGYELAMVLAAMSNRVSVTRFDARPVDDLLKKRLGFGCDALAERAAYYANARVSTPHRPEHKYIEIAGPPTDRAPDRFRYCCAEWTWDRPKTSCEIVIDLNNEQSFAIPSDGRLVALRIRDVQTDEWIPIPTTSLTVGADRARGTRVLRVDLGQLRARVAADEAADEAADRRASAPARRSQNAE